MREMNTVISQCIYLRLTVQYKSYKCVLGCTLLVTVGTDHTATHRPSFRTLCFSSLRCVSQAAPEIWWFGSTSSVPSTTSRSSVGMSMVTMVTCSATSERSTTMLSKCEQQFKVCVCLCVWLEFSNGPVTVHTWELLWFKWLAGERSSRAGWYWLKYPDVCGTLDVFPLDGIKFIREEWH